ncbi:MAG: hypothetical protein SOZ34_08445 [Clostridia bacterium]|nr:hypothetical protein [Clostridia bacterium]
MNQNSNDFFLYTITVLPILLICIAVFFLNVIYPFNEKRKFIKSEIRRSDGKEYNYWKRELKKLYIEHIPIFGWLIRKLQR